MMRLFVSGLILAGGVIGQLTGAGTSTQCCDPREASCQSMISQCMSSSFSTDSARCNSICDPSRPDCQTMINQCMASSTATSTSRCQSLACSLPGADSTFKPSPIFTPDSTFKPSPPPPGPITDSTLKPSPPPSGPITDSSPASTPRPSIPAFTAIPSFGGDGNVPTNTCCDGTTEMCKMSISMCLSTTGNPSMCERMACPSPGASAYPTPRQCCDGSMPGCQMSYSGCMNQTQNADMCAMIICPEPGSSPYATRTPISSQCCDPTMPACQMTIQQCLMAGQSEVLCKSMMCPAPPTFAPTRVPDESPRSSPEIRETARPTRSAAPTMFIKPLFSPMPSRLPRRTAAPTSYVIPDRMPAELKFPKANLTMFKKPEKIQEIQAKLACALRLPLEKIEIRNISILRATGKLEDLGIDVSVARLTSNGSTNCMVFKDDPVVPQVTSARRNLQGSTDSIIVNYDIVSPPIDIATSPAGDLNAAITGDASMIAFANSVGSAGLTAEVSSISAPAGGGVPSGASNGPTSSGSDTTQAPNTISAIGVGVGVAVGAVAVIGVGVAMSIYRNRKRRQARQVIQPVDATVWRQSVVQVNPAHGSVRAMYAPGQVRSGV